MFVHNLRGTTDVSLLIHGITAAHQRRARRPTLRTVERRREVLILDIRGPHSLMLIPHHAARVAIGMATLSEPYCGDGAREGVNLVVERRARACWSERGGQRAEVGVCCGGHCRLTKKTIGRALIDRRYGKKADDLRRAKEHQVEATKSRYKIGRKQGRFPTRQRLSLADGQEPDYEKWPWSVEQ